MLERDEGTGYLFEASGAWGVASFEDVDHGADEALAVADELSFGFEIQTLVQKAEAGENEEFVLVEAEGEGHSAFFEELDKLYDVLA